jgi:hypothetical protein
VITNRDGFSCQEASFSGSTYEKCNDNEKRKTSPSATTLNMAAAHRTSLCINRTQTILEKASRGFASSTSADLLSTARRLGINVMSVRLLERYVDKFMKKSKSLSKQNDDDENGSDKSVNGSSVGEGEQKQTGPIQQQQQQRNSGSSLKATSQKSKGCIVFFSNFII